MTIFRMLVSQIVVIAYGLLQWVPVAATYALSFAPTVGYGGTIAAQADTDDDDDNNGDDMNDEDDDVPGAPATDAGGNDG